MSVLIIGAGGLARDIADWTTGVHEVAGFWSEQRDEASMELLTARYFTGKVTPGDVGTDQAFMGIASPAVKARLHRELTEAGFKFPTFVHPTSLVSGLAEVGEGVFVAPQSAVSARVSLGTLAFVNVGCGIGHDTRIGDYVQVNPGAQVGGNVTIGNEALIGSGSTILQQLDIGAGSTVGSGAVCFKDVPEGVSVMGNPARGIPGFG